MNSLAGFGNVDLKLTGDFQFELFVDVRADTFVIDSADEKSQKLKSKYGEMIFGLADDYSDRFVLLARPKTIRNFEDALNKKVA